MACKSSFIQFDPATCVLSGTNAQGDPVSYNLGAAIAAKLDPGGISWDPAGCLLTGKGPDGVVREFNIGAAILEKFDQTGISWDPTTCVLTGLDTEGVVRGFDLGTAIVAKVEIPEFVSKTGAKLPSPIVPLLAADFENNVFAEATDKLMALRANGSCLLVDFPKGSTTAPSANGEAHIITTNDEVQTTVCLNPVKGLRPNGDGTFTVMYADDVEGDTFQYVQDTDQRLTNPVITQETVNGVTTHTVTWDVVDIEGNVVGQETATGIQVPVFVDKAGAPLAGPISPLLAEQFADGTLDAGDKLLSLGPDGSCKKVGAITQYGAWCSEVSVEGNITNADGSEYLDADGNTVAAVDGSGNAIPAGTDVYVTTDKNGINPTVCVKASDGGSNILDPVTGVVNILREHRTSRPINVLNDQFVTSLSIHPAFTDGVSDVNVPGCRTEIVCGGDGRLYGPAPHVCYDADVFALLSWNGLTQTQQEHNDDAANPYSGGLSSVMQATDTKRTFTNTNPCRQVKVRIGVRWARAAAILMNGAGGSIGAGLCMNNQLQPTEAILHGASANSLENGDHFRIVPAIGGYTESNVYCLDPGDTLDYAFFVGWYWGQPVNSEDLDASVFGFSGSALHYYIKAETK